MNQREKNDLDNHITGHYGEDQFKDDEEPPMSWESDCMKWRGKVLKGPDCHWCADWDYLPVSAFTVEYSCCDEKKTILGRICNWFYMRFFNLVSR